MSSRLSHLALFLPAADQGFVLFFVPGRFPDRFADATALRQRSFTGFRERLEVILTTYLELQEYLGKCFPG